MITTTRKQERRRTMSVGQEAYKNIGPMCCGSWVHHRHPALRKKLGILLVTIGLIWLGARVGVFDFTWLHAVHFWPAIVILFGSWLVYKGVMREKPRTIDKKRKEM
jgi:hypothetical protein